MAGRAAGVTGTAVQELVDTPAPDLLAQSLLGFQQQQRVPFGAGE